MLRGGLIPYGEALLAQRALAAARREGAIGDLVLLVEHPPTYTRGRRATDDELPMGADWYRMQGIEVTDTDRGGRVTYHGPGQLVAYPIVDLAGLAPPDDVAAFVASLEEAMIGALAERGVGARTIAGLTGVWVGASPPPPAMRARSARSGSTSAAA